MQKKSITSRKSSTSSAGVKLKLVNDFRLGPIKRFKLCDVDKILKEKTDAAFNGLGEYNFDDMSTAGKFLSTDILSACNDLKWPAFKIVISIKIIELKSQTARGCVRYYWNAADDGLANYAYESVQYKVLVTAAFLYYE